MRFRCMHPSATATVILVGACLFSGVGAVQAQCDETDSQWRRVEINLGSGVAAPIVENAGQLSDDVAFGAIGATGTGARFRANGRVDLVVSLETDFARIGFEPIDTDGPVALAPTEPIWATVVYIAERGPGTLPAWGAVEAHGMWGGAVVEHQVTGRTWRMHLTGEAADLGRLAWRPEGIAGMTADERSGDLRLTLEADATRQLTLHPAKVTLDEETQYLPFTFDAEGILRLSGEVPEGASLETTLVMAPYYHRADAVADGRGGFLAAGVAVDTLEIGGASGRDIVVVRTDADGRAFRGMTILASSGDDRPAGIASRFGDAYLAGTAGAADFPLPAKLRGQTWPSPFAIRLATSGELRAGRYLRSDGLETARDLAVDAEGRVLISGAATAKARDTGELQLTAVLPVDEDAPRVTYALASFDGHLEAAEGFQTFDGAATGLPLEVRIDCDGSHHVGLQVSAGAQSCHLLFPEWRPRSYPQPGPGVPLPGIAWLDSFAEIQQPSFPFASWGFHALRWKQESYNFPPIYNANAASMMTSPAVPVGYVEFQDAASLDTLEGTQAIFPAGDPAGTWQANTTTALIGRQGLEAALGAAAYAAFWKSPTYMNLSLNYPATDGVGVMEVTFCTFADPFGANGLGPVEICQNNLPTGLPIDVFDASCVDLVPLISDVNQVFLDEVRLHQWYTPSVGILAGELNMPGHEFMTRFEQANPGGVYIGDPPAEARFAAGQISEAIDRQMAFMVEDIPVEITTFVDGKASTAEAGIGRVRSVDRREAP